MKPRTKFQHMVAASNMKLSAISPKAIDWAFRTLIKHPAFRTPSHTTTCGDCGHSFSHKGKEKYVCCPNCGRKLEVCDTLKRTIRRSVYFSVLDSVDGFQIQRVFLFESKFKKGKLPELTCSEVCRLWLNSKGQSALTGRKRSLGYYLDCFDWGSEIELRDFSDVFFTISDTYFYPKGKLIPELKRNGMRLGIKNAHPFFLMKYLLTDNRIETMAKMKDYKSLCYFTQHINDLDLCWSSYKVARRNGYAPKDISLWCDLIKLLDRFGRDIHNPKYVCPANLKAEHDKWFYKIQRMEEAERNKVLIAEAKKSEEVFIKDKSRYFGIRFNDSDIEISVLDSIEAYKEEGENMHHCVFQCKYYEKSDSIILSAHDRNGNRIETIEYSLSLNKVVQSRGVCNSNTEYHDRIIRLVNDNAYRFIKAKESA